MIRISTTPGLIYKSVLSNIIIKLLMLFKVKDSRSRESVARQLRSIGLGRATALAVSTTGLMAVAGCTLDGGTTGTSLRLNENPRTVMVGVARTAQKCWFAKDETAFSDYRLADETNSPAGRPRILLVPRNDPAALPLLVVQAENTGRAGVGGFTDLAIYGPILQTGLAERIVTDIRRWSEENQTC